MLKCIRSLIEELEEPARSVMQYRLYSEISYAEISQLLEIRPGTAAVIFNRTLAKLRKTLKERYGYEI
jgi:RNA polymerase sigma-70 factor (ECF subfamily)